MRTKFIKIIFILFAIGIVFGVWYFKFKPSGESMEAVREIQPAIGTISSVISTTGEVLPKNRLELKPPVPGRIEQILVREGQDVKKGQVVAWMSSTERAAMLDFAAGQGEEALKYWRDVYKAIPLTSPIDGEVIVATMQPGQTVTVTDAVIVLSDKLIVRAQVDETDIGKVKLNQKAIITLDAYPDVKINAKVEHIYYESQTVNNVTIYQVDLTPENVPDFFRSGMNATVEFIAKSKDNVLLLPLEAVHKEKDESFVYVAGNAGERIKKIVTTGMSDDKNIEIVSGITENDKVTVKSRKFVIPQDSTTTSPFMPFGRGRGTGGRR
ncbi:MAG: efflux RND transporter periplasmic adaptor subunit [Candidatus Omnitrophica bacterium]|nr:efflux RND transporter periplasmic adaptor subunit [Candidatus Omnitrophota bacterium]